MEKEIIKPNLIKGIPISIVRPLPTLFYYGKFASGSTVKNAFNYFKQSCAYLIRTLELLTAETKESAFKSLTTVISELPDTDNRSVEEKVLTFTAQLSTLCSEHQSKIKDNPLFSKEQLAQVYKSIVQTFQILLLDNNNEPVRVTKISTSFSSTGYFDVATTHPHAHQFIDKLQASDFIVYASAYPITVNEYVLNARQYKKPMMVLAEIKNDKKIDQQTLRNGSWLQSKGFDVLYKVFTPLRLFTSVDRIYMKFHLINS